MDEAFDLIINDEGKMMLLITAYDEEPDHADIVVTGKTVIFYRNPHIKLDLSDLTNDQMEHLQNNSEVLVCEMGFDGEFTRTYMVLIKKSTF